MTSPLRQVGKYSKQYYVGSSCRSEECQIINNTIILEDRSLQFFSMNDLTVGDTQSCTATPSSCPLLRHGAPASPCTPKILQIPRFIFIICRYFQCNTSNTVFFLILPISSSIQSGSSSSSCFDSARFSFLLFDSATFFFSLLLTNSQISHTFTRELLQRPLF